MEEQSDHYAYTYEKQAYDKKCAQIQAATQQVAKVIHPAQRTSVSVAKIENGYLVTESGYDLTRNIHTHKKTYAPDGEEIGYAIAAIFDDMD